MQIKYKIKTKPSFLKPFGILYNSAQAIFNTIWIPKYLLDRINQGDINSLSIIEHEKTHILRAQKYGMFKWYLMYCFSNSFRLKEEIEAIRIEFKYLKKNNIIPDYEKKAKWLSSLIYLNMISYDEALNVLKAM